MAKIKFNGLVDEIRGGVGGLVVRKSRGKFMLSNKPDTTTLEPTQAQAAQRQAFGRAVGYGKMVMEDSTLLAFYEALAEQKEKPAFSLAVGDFLTSPTIDDPDFSQYKGNMGDRILINTYDDTGAITVNVVINHVDGTTLERGQAVEMGAGTGYWVYTATAAVAVGTEIFVEVEAFDRPGNRAVFSANRSVGMN